jgi:hypothetical protein
MAVSQYTGILNLITAKKGTSGSTDILGARRARIVPNHIKRTFRAGASVVPEDVIIIGANPQVLIETESRAEEAAGYVPDYTKHMLVLSYQEFATASGAAATRTRTIKYARFNGVRESSFPPIEDTQTPRFELVFDIVTAMDATVDTLAEVFVDA